MTSTKKTNTMLTPSWAWDQVGEQWGTMGKHLGSRLEKMRATSAEDRLAFEHSVREMLTAIQDALGEAGAVVRDRKVRKDLAELTQRVHDAIQLTMGAAEKEVRDRLPKAPRRGPKSVSASSKTPDKQRRPATKKVDTKKATRATSTRAKAAAS